MLVSLDIVSLIELNYWQGKIKLPIDYRLQVCLSNIDLKLEVGIVE